MKWQDVVTWVFLCLLMTTSCHDGYAAQKKEKVDVMRPGQITSFGAEREADFAILHEGQERRYRVHLPPSYDGSAETPVVIFVHGGGGDIRSGSRDKLDKDADKLGFILAVPVATKVLGGPLGTRWNGGRWKGGQCCGNADDVGFISKMIDALQKNFRVDAKCIYAAGISNGGLMVNRLACELADKIAAVAAVAPAAILDGCKPSRPISVMLIQGTEDPAHPLDGSPARGLFGKADYERMTPKEVLESWLRINGCSPETMTSHKRGGVTFTSYKGAGDVEVLYTVVEKMGHTWPSGMQYAFKSMIGSVSHELSTDDIWAFFQKHPRR